MKRIVLFLITNLVVVLTISCVVSLLNLGPVLTSHGIDYNTLMIICLIWGMGGACISLALSRKMAKWMMRIQLVDDTHRLYTLVERLARDAGLPDTPEVGIFSSRQMNAFATGPTKRRALVAVSSGLLDTMNERELTAVLAHEISHISNGDMVTLTLIQGVVNAFVMFLARAAAFALSGMSKNRNSRGSFGSYIMLTMLFEVVFMIFGSMVVSAFSRFREYRADRGGAMLTRKEDMIAALQTLQRAVQTPLKNKSLNAMLINAPRKSFALHLFATHPSIDNRIERLSFLP